MINGVNMKISLSELTGALIHQRRAYALFSAPLAILSVLGALMYPRTYVASTTFMPPQQAQSSAMSTLVQLGTLAGLSSSPVAFKPSEELYMAFLRTKTVTDAVAKEHRLVAHYDAPDLEAAVKILKDRTNIQSDKKSGLVTVTVDDDDANYAAKVANGYISSLRVLTDRLAITEAQQRAKFLEAQVDKTAKELAEAQQNLSLARNVDGISSEDLNAQAALRSSAQIRSEIGYKEAQLQVASRFQTQNNPEYVKVAAELSALKQALAKVENGAKSSATANPSGTRTALDLLRQVKLKESALEVMVRQLEIAKVDVAKEGPLVQQVDVAEAPAKPTKPRRLYLAAAFLVATQAILVLALALRWSRQHGYGGSRIDGRDM